MTKPHSLTRLRIAFLSHAISILLLAGCGDSPAGDADVVARADSLDSPEESVELACRRDDGAQSDAAGFGRASFTPAETRKTPFRCLRFADANTLITADAGSRIVNIAGTAIRPASGRELQIPLHEIKTKGFLKGRTLVVVSDGTQYAALEKECSAIREAGVTEVVAILPDAGNSTVAGAPARIAPDRFVIERLYGAWHILNLSKEKLPPLLATADSSKDPAIDLNAGRQGSGLERTLIVVDGDTDVSELRGSYRGQVFVLDGGVAGLQQLQAEVTAMARALAQPRINERGCAG